MVCVGLAAAQSHQPQQAGPRSHEAPTHGMVWWRLAMAAGTVRKLGMLRRAHRARRRVAGACLVCQKPGLRRVHALRAR